MRILQFFISVKEDYYAVFMFANGKVVTNFSIIIACLCSIKLMSFLYKIYERRK